MALSCRIATIGRRSWAGPQAPAAPAPAAEPDQDWIARSNGYTELLLDITKKHSPESASAEGLAQYDEQISQPTKQDEDAAIAETKQVQAQLTRALETEPDKRVRQDLSILLHSHLTFIEKLRFQRFARSPVRKRE